MKRNNITEGSYPNENSLKQDFSISNGGVADGRRPGSDSPGHGGPGASIIGHDRAIRSLGWINGHQYRADQHQRRCRGEYRAGSGTAVTGQAQITLSNGVYHIADDAARKAKDDLITAYNDAAGRGPVTIIPTQLGNQTLLPGVYASADGTFNITGTLTLSAQGDPNAVFIFKTASTLVTASSSVVSLIGGARYCRVFWQVGSSATLGTNSTFVGHIMAMESITATTGAFIQGQLMARTAAVTLDTNTIVNGFCPTIPSPTPISSATPVPGYTLAPGVTLIPGVTFIPGTTIVPRGVI